MLAHLPVLSPAGLIAIAQGRVIFSTFFYCALVVVLVYVLLFYFLWKYRATRASMHHTPSWDHDSAFAEASWWLVPSIIIFILALLAWNASHALDPYRPIAHSEPPLEVEVIALDWKWLFIYPEEHVATVNTLTIPTDRPVHFRLTADAPMNSFWVPSLGGQIMVMPGMETQLHLLAEREGAYAGYSANLSGEGFSGMTFTTNAVAPEAFALWVARAQAATTTLSTERYHELSKPSTNLPPATYSLIDNSIYNRVMTHYMQP